MFTNVNLRFILKLQIEKLFGGWMLFVLLLLCFNALNGEVLTISTATDATAIARVLGIVFPFIYITGVVALGGLMVYVTTKEMK